MTTFLVLEIWFGGMNGAADAGRGLWWCLLWPFYVTQQLVMEAAARGKGGE